MPACARNKIVEEGAVAAYHVWTRCVQQDFLLGQHGDQNYDHRREWLESLLKYQAGVFAVEIGNYNILNNHYHLIVRTRPDLVVQWSAEEVAWRYTRAWCSWDFTTKRWDRAVTDERVEWILEDEWRVAAARWNLQSLSTFMARINEPIAKLANGESGRGGHFWAERYRSRKLDGLAAILTCSAYLDLNQVRAGMADSYSESERAAASRRVDQWKDEQAQQSLQDFQRRTKGRQEFSQQEMRALLDCSWLAPIGEDTSGLMADFRLPPIAAPGARCGVLIPSPTWALDEDEPSWSELVRCVTAAAKGAAESADAAASGDTGVGDSGSAGDAAEQEAQRKKSKAGSRASRPKAAPRPGDPGMLAAEIAQGSDEAIKAAAAGGSPGTDAAMSGGGGLGGSEPSGLQPTFKIHERMLRQVAARASDAAILAMPLDAYLRIVNALEAKLKNPKCDFSPSDARVLTEMGVRPENWAKAVDQFNTSFGRVVGEIQLIEAMLARLGLNWIKGIQACRDHFT